MIKSKTGILTSYCLAGEISSLRLPTSHTLAEVNAPCDQIAKNTNKIASEMANSRGNAIIMDSEFFVEPAKQLMSQTVALTDLDEYVPH